MTARSEVESMSVLDANELAVFRDLGYVRVRRAFDPDDAAAMRDEVWTELERTGIRRDDPSTWKPEPPTHLQHLKKAPAFKAIGTDRTLGAIDDVMGAGNWQHPRDWGAFFILFPTGEPWTIARRGWHIDAPYDDPLVPPAGLKIHSLFGDIGPRAGGMQVILRSHHMMAAVLGANPALSSERAVKIRTWLMQSDPWLRALGERSDPAARIAMFHEQDHEVFGVPVRVDELTGDAGDLVLIHPLLLHNRPVHPGQTPRFLLNKDIRASPSNS
jgi:hypothetical protein